MTARASALLEATRDGDRAALARLLSVVEAGGDDARAAIASLPVSVADRAWTVGITGAPGAGKSTLTDHLVAPPARRGRAGRGARGRPQQPVHRWRHPRRPRAHATTTRPIPTCSSGRWPPAATSAACPGRRRRRSGCSPPPGTAGSWWRRWASARWRSRWRAPPTPPSWSLNPGWGDGVQAAKAGLLEVGDVFVVNKADRAGLDATVRDLRSMLELVGGAAVAAADRGDRRHRGPGRRRPARRRPPAPPAPERLGELAERRERRIADELRALVLDRLSERADDFCSGPRFATVVRQVADGASDPYTAATLLSEGADRGEPER